MQSNKPPTRRDDYVGALPHGIFPTRNIDVLEQRGHLLFIKNYEHGTEITPKQRQIWQLLVHHGEMLDSPGSITVLCVWGLGPDTIREVVTFDQMGESKKISMSLQDFKNILNSWFLVHKN